MRLAALCSPELGACMDSQFGEVLGTEVGQFVMLPMRPEVFDWIQFGCIGWQVLQVDGARLAPYAPELNPVEYLWAHWKHHELANFCPKDFAELTVHARAKLRRTQRRKTHRSILEAS